MYSVIKIHHSLVPVLFKNDSFLFFNKSKPVFKINNFKTVYISCVFILSVCITDSMLTRSEPSLDTDPGSWVWISVRITPTLYPGKKKQMPKICLMKLVFYFKKKRLEFCKTLLWNMEWEMFLVSTCIINSKRVTGICLLSLEIKPWSQEIEYKKFLIEIFNWIDNWF